MSYYRIIWITDCYIIKYIKSSTDRLLPSMVPKALEQKDRFPLPQEMPLIITADATTLATLLPLAISFWSSVHE